MIRRLFAVAVVATVMAWIGTFLVIRVEMGETNETFTPIYLHVIAVSNVMWHLIARSLHRRRAPLWQGLALGLISPLLGGLTLPFGVPVILKAWYVSFPVGVVTGDIVWRLMSSSWSGRARAA